MTMTRVRDFHDISTIHLFNTTQSSILRLLMPNSTPRENCLVMAAGLAQQPRPPGLLYGMHSLRSKGAVLASDQGNNPRSRTIRHLHGAPSPHVFNIRREHIHNFEILGRTGAQRKRIFRLQ